MSLPQKQGVVVQLVRIPACHAGGRGFESRPYRKRREENEKQQAFGLRFSFFFCFFLMTNAKACDLSATGQGHVRTGREKVWELFSLCGG